MKSIEPAIDRVKEIDWFTNVGLPCQIQFEMHVESMNSWKMAVANRGRNATSNALLEGTNILTRDLGLHFRMEYRKWNDFVELAQEALETEVTPSVESAVDRIGEVQMRTDSAQFLKDAVLGDIVFGVMEHVYSDLVPPRFYTLLLDVYKTGHFPCGWNEVWPNGKLWVY